MVYFLKLHVYVYVRAKFQISCIILTRFWQGGVIPPPPQLKTNPKKPTQIMV